MFTPDEDALRETVQRFSREVIGPHVSKMDEVGKIDPEILPALFSQGPFPSLFFVMNIFIFTRL
jgi:hypothetical protein